MTSTTFEEVSSHSSLRERMKPVGACRNMGRGVLNSLKRFEVFMAARSLPADEASRHLGLTALEDINPEFATQVRDRAT